MDFYLYALDFSFLVYIFFLVNFFLEHDYFLLIFFLIFFSIFSFLIGIGFFLFGKGISELSGKVKYARIIGFLDKLIGFLFFINTILLILICVFVNKLSSYFFIDDVVFVVFLIPSTIIVPIIFIISSISKILFLFSACQIDNVKKLISSK